MSSTSKSRPSIRKSVDAPASTRNVLPLIGTGTLLSRITTLDEPLSATFFTPHICRYDRFPVTLMTCGMILGFAYFHHSIHVSQKDGTSAVMPKRCYVVHRMIDMTIMPFTNE